MDDIRRQDLRLFMREALTPTRLVVYAVSLFVLFQAFSHGGEFQGGPAKTLVVGAFLCILTGLSTGWQNSYRKRFANPRMRSLWEGCRDRLVRFEEAHKRVRQDQKTELKEMPKTIRRVADNLYIALRRADTISHEVMTSERGLYNQPPVWNAKPGDPQSKELYRLADKNIAEYKSLYSGVMAGVERTEAQSAMFMTTLDTLRMKMIGYRLVGKNPELISQDFIESLVEAKAQLQAIDTALEELDLGHYPKMIAAVPPPPPTVENSGNDQAVQG